MTTGNFFVTMFTMDRNPNVKVREVFSGPLLALIGGSLPDMTVPFQQLVAGLKPRAETGG